MSGLAGISKQINTKFDQFISKVRKEMGNIDEINEIQIWVEGIVKTLKDVKFRAIGDIWNHADVKKYRRKGGYIVSITFISDYQKYQCKIKAKVSISSNHGHIKIYRRRNSMAITREALAELLEIFYEVFS